MANWRSKGGFATAWLLILVLSGLLCACWLGAGMFGIVMCDEPGTGASSGPLCGACAKFRAGGLFVGRACC